MTTEVSITLESDKVKCYSGYTYATSPQTFYWEGEWHRIQEVRQAWQEPEGRCFLVVTEAERLFRLCYMEKDDRWQLAELVVG